MLLSQAQTGRTLSLSTFSPVHSHLKKSKIPASSGAALRLAQVKVTATSEQLSGRIPAARLDRATMADMRYVAPIQHLSEASADKIGVVHFGIGKLFRGLWAEKIQAHMNATGSDGYQILAIDRTENSKGYKALKVQQGLYTRHIKDSSSDVDLQLVQSIREVGALSLEADRQKVLDAMSSPDFKAASLTLTPKGYDLSDQLLSDEAALVREATAAIPVTPFGLIVQGQKNRFEKGFEAFPVLTLENIAKNGEITRSLLLQIADKVSPEFSEWLDTSMETPSAMVDRICPSVAGENGVDAMRLITRSGESALEDLAAVSTEGYGLIALEQSSNTFLQELDATGALEMTNQLDRIDRIKFSLVNGAHTIAGIINNTLKDPASTLPELLERPGIARFMNIVMDEMVPTLPVVKGFDLAQYRDQIWSRLTNKNLPDDMQRLGSEVTRKVPQYLSPILQSALDKKMPNPALMQVLAAAELSLKRENPELDTTEFLTECVLTTEDEERLKTGLDLARKVVKAQGFEQIFSAPELVGTDTAQLFADAGLDYLQFLQSPQSLTIESKKPITVLFDNDGTLVDSEYLALEAARELINVIIEDRHAGAPLDQKAFAAHFPGLNFNLILEKLNQVRPDIGLTPGDIAYYTEVEETNCQHLLAQRVTPTANTSQVLDMLAANNIQSQVVTSATMGRAEVALKKSGLRGQVNPAIFSAVNTLPTPQPKPSPAVYEYAKVHTKSAGPETQLVAVEDSSSGIKSAVAAGVDVIAYVGGQHHSSEQRYLRGQEFLALGAKAVFDNMALLPLVLTRLDIAQGVHQNS